MGLVVYKPRIVPLSAKLVIGRLSIRPLRVLKHAYLGI